MSRKLDYSISDCRKSFDLGKIGADSIYTE
jgi:hypothetical protein